MCNMKRIILLFSVTALAACLANAQPAKRRNTTAASTTQNASVQKKGTDRASMQFPTSASMPEDVVWKRDIYRQLDLTKDKNAPLYYPVEPQGKQVNLFTYLFRLILTGRIPAYTYQLDGNESFEAKDKLAVKDMLERYGIYYEEKDGKIQVADSDVPSGEATRYYLKESVYLDQRTGTFSTKVTALCPVLMRGADEFSTEATPYPLFWVQYSDVAPWLSRLPVMGSNLNNVTNMTADIDKQQPEEGKFYWGLPKDMDPKTAIDRRRLWSFLHATQQQELDKYVGTQMEKEVEKCIDQDIRTFGIIHVMKNSVKVQNLELRLFFPRPTAARLRSDRL